MNPSVNWRSEREERAKEEQRAIQEVSQRIVFVEKRELYYTFGH